MLLKLLKKAYYNTPKERRLFFKRIFFQLRNFGFQYTPEEGLKSLKFKILIFDLLNKSKMSNYKTEIDFIRNKSNALQPYSFTFPYTFVFEHNYNEIKVEKNPINNLYYIDFHGKLLYYNSSFKTINEVVGQFFSILLEQDYRSPHCYFDNSSYQIEEGDIVVDVGAAEGNFALQAIEKLRHLYIFEADPAWKDALEATYAPWKHKVSIFYKLVSDFSDEKHVTLDEIFNYQDIDVIKIDVEGMESQVLKGASQLLLRTSPKMFVCTYHRGQDAHILEKQLSELGFKVNYSQGYMLFIQRTLLPPYFRKGLIRAKKLLKLLE